MEVHAHTRPPDSPGIHLERKKWTHYFWEFLMLFLAVFCGFLAENQREQMVEHRREKEFMVSLIKDLQLDTAYLNSSDDSKKQRNLSIDSVLQFFSNHPDQKQIPLTTCRQMLRSTYDQVFWHYGGTIDQLKNSGGMRLIRKNEIVDSIEMYYQQVHRGETRSTAYFENQQSTYSLSEKLWSATDNIKYFHDNLDGSKTLPDSGVLAINTAYLNEYLNNLMREKRGSSSERNFIALLKQRPTRLISMIKKEYRQE